MALPALIPLVAAGVSALGGVASGIANSNQASKQRSQNMKLAEYSYTKDLEMWNKNNEYNNPTNQMSRLKAAGLNPNLVYGNGSVAGNTSTQVPKYQRPEVPRANWKLEIPNAIAMMSQYQDVKNKGVQHDNLTAQTELMKKESEIKSLNMMKILAETAKSTTEKNRIEKMVDQQLRLLESQTLHENLKMNITGKDWENYKKHGLRPNDPLIYRVGANAWDDTKAFFKNWLQGAKNAPIQNYKK